MRKFKLALILFLSLIFLSFPLVTNTVNVSVSADDGVSYKTYTEDAKKRIIPTQNAYLAINILNTFNGTVLKNPSDLFLDKNDTLYIADTGNKRIVVVTKNMASVTEITHPNMKKPTGVYVTENGDIYVADPDAEKVLIFDKTGALINEITRPTSILYGSATIYRPSKVIVDKRGNIYIVGDGNYNGLIRINKQNEYLGYFGTNKSQATARQKLLKSIFSEEIVETYFKVVPRTPSNLATDDDGFIYTITRGTSSNTIRKINVGGDDKLNGKLTVSETFNDITVGPISNIYAVDDNGMIYEYDQEGNLLFMFGGKDQRSLYKGLFNMPSSIVCDNSFNLYVLDSAKNELHVFVPTEFATLVHEALYFYQEGFYINSKEPWERVLEYNYMFDLAHRGIGQAYYKEGDMKNALERFEMIGYKEGYSNAYWELRNDWLISNLNYIFVGLVILYILMKLYGKFLKPKVNNFLSPYKKKLASTSVVSQANFALKIRKNPTDVMLDIQRDRGITNLFATGLYVILFVVKILEIYLTGPAFSNVDVQFVSLVSELVKFMGPIFLMIVANFMVSTITEGQGKFSQVYRAVACCFIPYIILVPINALLSNVLTLNEAFIYNFINIIAYGWVGVLVFVMIKDLHNFSVGEVFVNIFLTLFAFCCFAVAIMLLNNVLGQLYDFILQVVKEVFVRV